MKIEIHNYLSCSFLLENEPDQWDSIVILDSKLPESQFVIDQSRRFLQLSFDDITSPVSGQVAPYSDAIEQAIQFGTESEKLIVCCRAGQSRSSATAFSVLYEKLGSQAALELLNPKRHSPNYLILQIADRIIDRPGILDAYDEWGSSAGDIRLLDYLEEIEAEYNVLRSQGAENRIEVSG
jgi:predicted protein tyrosine phosphatase